jgi:DinB family protein
MKNDKALRKDLQVLLRGGRAHVGYDKAVADLPEDLRGKKPRGTPYSPWQQIEHIRICQWDILEYIRNPKYKALKWPDEYWPKEAAPPSAEAWEKSLKAYRADLRAVLSIVADPSTDLLATLPHDPETTMLHEVLLLADHTAYHLGQLLVLRRLIGAWAD